MAHALVYASFSEGDLMGTVLEEFARDGWLYEGTIDGPQTSSGGGVAIMGIGNYSSTVDRDLYLVFSKPGDHALPARLVSATLPRGKRDHLAVKERVFIFDGHIRGRRVIDE